MIPDAEQHQQELEPFNEAGGPTFKIKTTPGLPRWDDFCAGPVWMKFLNYLMSCKET